MIIEDLFYKAIKVYPYYARGFLSLEIVETDKIPTAGVDKYWRIYINPDFAEKNKYIFPQILRHELEHLLRDHCSRIKERNHKLWNLAADMEINDEIPELQVDEYIYPARFDLEDHNTSEYYYDRIPSSAKGQGEGDQEGEPLGSGLEGSGVTGKKEEWEKGKDSDCLSGPQRKRLIKDIAEDVVEHSSRKAGNVPNGVLMWATAQAKGKLPKIKWQLVVRNTISKMVNERNDFTFAKISRRQDRSSPFILPSNVKREVSCSVIVDTSMSMDSLGNWIAGCLKDILKIFRNNVEIIDCDVEIYSIRRLKTWKDVLKLRGGGGTDMRVGIEAALKRKTDLVLVLTDGETPWPEKMDRRVIPIINKKEY